MKSNYHVKISVSLPVNLIEKLDKITTYKGRSRSKYIANAVTQRMMGEKDKFGELDLNELLAFSISKLGNSEIDIMMKVIIRNYLNSGIFES